jgi:hypothetical protein
VVFRHNLGKRLRLGVHPVDVSRLSLFNEVLDGFSDDPADRTIPLFAEHIETGDGFLIEPNAEPL